MWQIIFLRMGSDKWVFLLNQWLLEEMVEAGKNLSLGQSSGTEWTQGRIISKILIMSDLGKALMVNYQLFQPQWICVNHY